MFLEKFLEGLTDRPFFIKRTYLDINPVSRQRKIRTLEMPNEAMEVLHKELIRYLRKLDVDLHYATGSVRGASPLRNVRKHFGHEYFYALDLHNAFPSVNGERLASVLCRLDTELADQEKEVLRFLEQYCLSFQGGLPVGAPASPDLFNIYAAVLIDSFLGDLCKHWESHWGQNFCYTRYLDDLCVSSDSPIGDRKRRTIRSIIQQAGFQINHRKSHVWELNKGPVVITGVGLRREGDTFITFLPRGYFTMLRGLIFRAQKNPLEMFHQVEGKMGVFKAVTDMRHLNRTEQALMRDYSAFKHIWQRARREQSRSN